MNTVAEEQIQTPTLSVQTKVITDGHPLLDYLPGPSSFAWVRNGNGLVAWGESARIVVNGRERFSRAQRWWSAVVRAAHIDDPLSRPGSGIVAFASFAFSSTPGDSVLIVPEVVIRRVGTTTTATVVAAASAVVLALGRADATCAFV